MMVTQFTPTVPVLILRGSPLSLQASADAVTNTLDLLLTGV
jgi:hypothetical protein